MNQKLNMSPKARKMTDAFVRNIKVTNQVIRFGKYDILSHSSVSKFLLQL